MADTRQLELHSLALLRTLSSGPTLSMLMGDPALGSFGDEETVLLEARMYLAEALATAAPELVARHGFANTARLEFVSVLLARPDLPRRLALTIPLRFACLVLPTKDGVGAWVVVPAIEHTFFLREDEELADITEAEIRRVVIARDYDPAAFLALFPAEGERLETLDFAVVRSAGEASGAKGSLAALEARKSALEVLALSAEPVHARLAGTLPPMSGRAREKQELATLLGSKMRGSVLLVGDERVGKSTILLNWLQTARDAGSLVFATSGARLIAGMSGFGQWQERVRRVMEAAHTLDAILWMSDLGDLFSDRPGSVVDIPSAMRRFLDENKVRVVGEVKSDLLERLTPRNAAFFACFSHVRVEPMSKAETLDALAHRGEFARVHEPDQPTLDAGARSAVLELTDRYMPYACLPGKAVRLADDVRSAEALRLGSRAAGSVLGAGAVYDTFSRRTGIPSFLLRDQESLVASEVEARLRQRVIGQEHAVKRVAELLSVVKAGLAAQGKPLATLLFVGPTGVGKTELARALAELLFGDEQRLTRFDMSEYADPQAAERLFRGTERGDGLLTRTIRQKPFGVVLLDEVEKAHPAVFDLLLQVCGEGRLTDGRGRTAYFHNAIVVMTSNLGAAHRRDSLGYRDRNVTPEEHYNKVVQAAFRPEFVGRLDRVVAFRSLTADENMQVARLAIARIARRSGVTAREIELSVDEDALRLVALGGTSEAYGARALKRHVERVIGTPLAQILAGDKRRAEIAVTLEDAPMRPGETKGISAHGLRFGVIGASAEFNQDAMRAIQQVANLRRPIRKQLALPVIEELREEVGILVTELGITKREHEKKDSGQLVAARLAEHARLAPMLEKLDAAHADLCALEELLLLAFFSASPAGACVGGELTKRSAEVAGLLADATESALRFEVGLAAALVALYPRRNGVSLLVSELDGHGAFDFYLAPLLRQANARAWQFELNVHGEGPQGGFGPAHSAKDFLALLTTPDRSFRHVLLRVQGENAGAWLGVETGLHRFVAAADGDDAHLFVRLAARRAALAEHELAALAPPLPDAVHQLLKQKPIRTFEDEHVSVRSGKATSKIVASAGTYWERLEAVVVRHLLSRDEQAELVTEIDTLFGDEPAAPVKSRK